MRQFEDILAEERRVEDARWEAEQLSLIRSKNRKQRTREERRLAKRSNFALAVSVILWCVLVCWVLTTRVRTAEPAALPETAAVVQVIPEPEDYENENIEAALLESGYFRDDVPLDCDTQAFLRSACEESGVEYELALAVIRKETEYRNLIGDGGDSYGYMQVQPVWHEERMERLGVTDLMDQYSNFRVGCDYLAELLDKYPMEEALTAYNSGSPGKSAYADTVLAYREELL